MVTTPIDLIYLDPESTDYHPGHARIFAARAARDPRIRSLHFALAPDYAEVAPDVLATIQAGPNLSFEFLPEAIARQCKPDGGLSSRNIGAVRWNEARRLLAARPGAIVFDSPFDNTLAAAALDRRPLTGQVTGVVMFCAPAVFSSNPVTRFKLFAKYLLSRRREIPVVFTFDRAFLDRAPRAITKSWTIAPDPLPLTHVQLQRLMSAPPPRAKDRVEFLLFGAIGVHKGLFEVLAALRVLPVEAAARVRVRFLGAFTEGGAEARARFLASIAETRAATGAEIVFDEGFATEDDLIDALIRCDAMLATRRRHQGVSNNLVWSAAAGRPVISQDNGWMGHTTREEALGLVCDPLDPAAIAAAIRQMLDPAWRAAFAVSGPRAFAAGHAADGYYEAIVSRLAGPRAPELARVD